MFLLANLANFQVQSFISGSFGCVFKGRVITTKYGCETWSLTLREERRLKVLENRVLRVFGPKRDEVTGNGENYIMKSLAFCTPYRILCGW